MENGKIVKNEEKGNLFYQMVHIKGDFYKNYMHDKGKFKWNDNKMEKL